MLYCEGSGDSGLFSGHSRDNGRESLDHVIAAIIHDSDIGNTILLSTANQFIADEVHASDQAMWVLHYVVCTHAQCFANSTSGCFRLIG